MRISDWSSDVCSSDLAIEITADHPIDVAARPVRAQFLAERIGAVEEVRRHIVDAVDAQPRVLLKEGPPVLRAGERGDGDVVQLQFEFRIAAIGPRSEEHTSELQSLMRNSYAVFCLKKKKK